MNQPRPYRRHVYTSRARRRAFRAQGQDLAQKAIVDLAGAALTGIVANGYGRAPYPDYAFCKSWNDVANLQANKASDSLFAVGVWGAIALFAAVVTD